MRDSFLQDLVQLQKISDPTRNTDPEPSTVSSSQTYEGPLRFHPRVWPYDHLVKDPRIVIAARIPLKMNYELMRHEISAICYSQRD